MIASYIHAQISKNRHAKKPNAPVLQKGKMKREGNYKHLVIVTSKNEQTNLEYSLSTESYLDFKGR
jgi:hypothetical protein